MLKIGYSAGGLTIDDGMSSIEVNKIRKGDTFFVGYKNAAIYLEARDVTQGLDGEIDLKCEIKDYSTLESLRKITIHLKTSWYEFHELES